VVLDHHCKGVSAFGPQQGLLRDTRTSDGGFQGAMVRLISSNQYMTVKGKGGYGGPNEIAGCQTFHHH
jgi:hypothetical protein